ncbi:erythroferrone isoform X1 [Accipiter gentilis]|uniref:erythroferrone isoform X1 n=1 Tax=Astur gentilis TaxID=8957 RepID=UPI00211075D0|nr:erythroferrone isoform X1 [Accipiter gentilis]
MRLPELCLALLCAAGSAGAAREGSPGPGAAAGRAAEAGRGGPGAAALRAGGVDPRQAWLLLAGSSGRGTRSRDRGRTGTMRDGTGAGAAPVPGGQSPGQPPQAALQVGVPGAAPAPPEAPAVLEELLRELHLLLRGMVKEPAKTRRKAWEGREEEEESGEGNPQAGSHRRVEAAFHCRTRENISVEQRGRQELQLYYIPEKEGMFHRGSGLNLTSGQYTAPIAGYYTFTATLHIVRREQQRKGQPRRGNRLRLLICVQSHCQHNSNLETVSWLESGSDLFTISVTGVLYLQAGQYASVFVDNAAGSPLTVQSGSDFSAILLGV